MMPYSYSAWVFSNLRNDYRYENNLNKIGTKYALMDVSRPLDTKLATQRVRYGEAGTPAQWPENVALWQLREQGKRAWIERDGARDAVVKTASWIMIAWF